ncbi:synaptic vesicle glycoprotein 2C-like [Ostrinia nubilalis]|uniref:synaptic vesicle glycoprotein 2C-like n=1 Tax=Ostrinia nubilalis TaxID=29057 RepID=UPI00308268B2
MTNKLSTLSKNVDDSEKYTADLDQALNVVGLGIYNIKYCFVLGLCLVAAIVEPVGYSYLLPASKCDLEMSDTARGFIGSIPYIGVVLTSFPWGYLVDTRGRKPILIVSSVAAGLLGAAAGLMPDLVTFTICKFLCSLCLACPAAAPYTYIGEILPPRFRDITLSVTNSMQILGSALVPLFGWAILPADFKIDLGLYYLRPWRVLCVVYAAMFILAAILMSFGPESPKYLVSQGRHEEALQVLRDMYAGNKGKSPEDFPIKALKVPDSKERLNVGFLTSLKLQTTPLLKPPFLKWMMLNGFLLFGVFMILNGLVMWIPDVLNRVLSSDTGQSMTACEVIGQGTKGNTTLDTVCIDTIDTLTFSINSIASIACSGIALVVSTTVKVIGKKILLILIMLVIGLFCIMINVTTQPMVFAILLSSMPLTGLSIGPINAYSVEIFPTELRGMAVSLSMMLGRLGSISGANIAGAMINTACEPMFYMFAGFIMFCSLCAFLLPKSQEKLSNRKEEITTHL